MQSVHKRFICSAKDQGRIVEFFRLFASSIQSNEAECLIIGDGDCFTAAIRCLGMDHPESEPLHLNTCKFCHKMDKVLTALAA